MASRLAVSVIIPAYKVTDYIGQALDSVLGQTFQDYEIIVINDGCPDTPALERVLLPYRDKIVYLKQENQGPAAARNAGLKVARAPLVAFLDPDDIWRPEYLAVQTGRMEADPTIDVLYCDAELFGEGPFVRRRYMEVCPSEGPVSFESLVTEKCRVMISVTARKESLLRAGLFDPELRSSEDFYLWLRVLKAGGQIAYHRQVLVQYRRRAGSLTTDDIWMCDNFLRALGKARYTMALTGEERRTVEGQIALITAKRSWVQGRHDFHRGDAEAAARNLAAGRQVKAYRTWKTWAALMLCRYAPWLVRELARTGKPQR